MKKINSLLLICFSLLLFAGCKKDSGGSANYYIKANIDGTEKTFASTPIVININQSGTYSLSMSAGASSSSTEGMGLQINQTSGPIAAGTYTDTSMSNNYVIGATYNPGSSDVSAIFGAGLSGAETIPLTIVITEITDSKVSGTFSGEFFDNGGLGSNSIMITNGQFNLPIQ